MLCYMLNPCFSLVFVFVFVLVGAGGLSYHDMSMQIQDGWSCFMGTNPNDPDGDCSNAAVLFTIYVTINFVYNILMLTITKRGSAVLLVISQVLHTYFVLYFFISFLFLFEFYHALGNKISCLFMPWRTVRRCRCLLQTLRSVFGYSWAMLPSLSARWIWWDWCWYASGS
jgi:hypothetical protein